MIPHVYLDDKFPVLGWFCDPRMLSEPTRIIVLVKLLRDSLHMSPMDFLLRTIGLDPSLASTREGFYKSSAIERFLSYTYHEPKGKLQIEQWMRPHALELVIDQIENEMETVARNFTMEMNDITHEFLINFNFDRDVTQALENESPWLRKILLAASQTPCALRENKRKTPEKVCSLVTAQLARMRSNHSSLCAIPFGFFLLSCGAPRKIIDLLSHTGLSPSYNSLLNAHTTLATRQITLAQLLVRTQPFGIGWDNTQISLSIHVEQRTKAPPKVQTGTASIVYALRNATQQNMNQLREILTRRSSLNLISYNFDIRPTPSQAEAIIRHLTISIVEILLERLPKLGYLKDSHILKRHSYRPPPTKYKTKEHVLRTTTLDEGSTEGTIDVTENIFLDQLQFSSGELDNTAVPSWNDQKTNALIRSAQLLRRGDVSAITRLETLQPAIGWFHAQLNLAWAILRIHREGSEDIGSLQYYISQLTKVRLGSDQPDYETLRSLFSQVLSGHTLHYWEVESGMSLQNLENSMPTAAKVYSLACTIFDKYASNRALNDLMLPKDDHTFANIVLLNHDRLVFYELSASISSGDFGRVEILIGTLTMMFAGAGCRNYTTELLMFIQNLKKVWTPDFADIVRDNSLISPSGHDGHYMGVDKNCEHNINFQKEYFASKGIHASWELLGHLSPNIPIYRTLKTQFMTFLGAPSQGTHHKHVDCSDQVEKVRSKAQKAGIEKPYIPLRHKTARRTINTVSYGKNLLQQKGLKAWEKPIENGRLE